MTEVERMSYLQRPCVLYAIADMQPWGGGVHPPSQWLQPAITYTLPLKEG